MGMSKDERRKLDGVREGLTVEEAERLMVVALNRVKLALSEVKVKEQWKDRRLVSAVVLNYDAIVRARARYSEAAYAIGAARQARGLTIGKQRPNPRTVEEASELLEYYRRELERLQALS